MDNILGTCVSCGKRCEINNCNPLFTVCSFECGVLAAGWESVEEYIKVNGNES